MSNTSKILGIDFYNNSFNNFCKEIEIKASNRQNTFIVTANPEIALNTYQDESFLEIVKQADFVVPDGIGIVKGAKMLDLPMKERISGYDIFLHMLDWGNKNHKSAYFVGAKPAIMSKMKDVIKKTYPNLKIAGIQDGYFKDELKVAKSIQKSNSDMVFIALGSPKQEYFINKYREVNNSIWIGLGGSFDVLSGEVKRAPKFWINHHIEWLYRLIKQPSRIGRMMAIPKFLRLIRKQKRL
ncbi:WecB/TagA/CpsF family glycosyltransferase [Apilactobacillus sp. TMW 2.2459]|uniref:WecB/TagA/CpsF family glycosyltransferase n=1 Tax=Apilactobacillus xinyiensis TaxID=2841032 RepID=UPI00200F4F00|nr:WecB/TagA/CpsF family glycosyltransferase [Apilactobacillus xinyiensis]MCL0312715.1 WecB/TagA/CpsF family glycosyltransferase [Apilactobacillus xinyiensis]